jgi:cation diffusion facilitator CzcD-associated flavoprotein CzcO
MDATMYSKDSEVNQNVEMYDAIVVGAGVGGLYQLYKLLQQGKRALCLEAAPSVGGVWYWNRYPGARLDSESYSYAYSFSQELLDEWNWSEHFATQGELLSYYNHVADKFGLRNHIRFNSLVSSMNFEEGEQTWNVRLDSGQAFRSRYVIMAIGPLSVPTYPNIKGRTSFDGESYHTSRWPLEPVSLPGKRVAVIGTGATGVQVIQEAAKVAAELVVFQRTPNYTAPLNNTKIRASEQKALKEKYPEIISRCKSNNTWYIHESDARSIFDLNEQEREKFLEGLYNSRGLATWKANFHDVSISEVANEIVSEFMRRKIRARVKDSRTAERLVPKTYGFGTRRVPLEAGYYEVYNQPNVKLVSLIETPIVEITPAGIKTADAEFEFDVIVFATGFDAITGSFDRIDIRGLNGQRLVDKWANGPSTFLGVHAAGFPNFFMAAGPLASVGNFGPALEFSVNWISDLIAFMDRNKHACVDVQLAHELNWTNAIRDSAKRLLGSKVASWFTGVNSNIEGRENLRVMLYVGSARDYRARCDEVRLGGYQQLVFGSNANAVCASSKA